MSAVRPRPSLRPCEKCGAACFMRIAPVREHGLGGEPTPMAVTYVTRARELGKLARAVSCVGPKMEQAPVGTFMLLVCEACGDARWYALDVDPETAANLIHDTLVHCDDCGDRRALHIARVKTRGRGGLPSDLRVLSWPSRRWGFTTSSSAGSFSAFVCRGCERVTWIANGIDEVPGIVEWAHPLTQCARCESDRVTIDPVNEDGATLRVLYAKRHLHEIRVGRFSLSICTGCGVTEWAARDIEALHPDPTLGVMRLEAADGNEGPYR